MLEELLDALDISFKWILIAFNSLTILLLYLYKKNNKRPRQHSVLLLTAHPDDESMFFTPTISSIASDYYVHLLCLSGGGTQREKELHRAAKVLNIHKVTCVKDEKLVDGMKEKWCEQTIRKYVTDYIKDNGIRAVFTFDEHGVSNHCNHCSVHFAVKALEVPEPLPQNKKPLPKATTPADQREQAQSMNQQNKEGLKDPIKIYYLQSANVIRKYSAGLEIPVALLQSYSWICFFPKLGWQAMSQHESQFVWYRRLWVLLSRYQYVNTFSRRWIKFSE